MGEKAALGTIVNPFEQIHNLCADSAKPIKVVINSWQTRREDKRVWIVANSLALGKGISIRTKLVKCKITIIAMIKPIVCVDIFRAKLAIEIVLMFHDHTRIIYQIKSVRIPAMFKCCCLHNASSTYIEITTFTAVFTVSIILSTGFAIVISCVKLLNKLVRVSFMLDHFW